MSIVIYRLGLSRSALDGGLRLGGTLRMIESINTCKDNEKSRQVEE